MQIRVAWINHNVSPLNSFVDSPLFFKNYSTARKQHMYTSRNYFFSAPLNYRAVLLSKYLEQATDSESAFRKMKKNSLSLYPSHILGVACELG